MKTTKKTQAEQLAALAALTPEQLETLAAIAATMTANETAAKAPQAPKAPKTAKAPKAAAKAPKGKKTAKQAPALHAGQWVSYRDETGAARMCKTQAGDDGLYVRSADGGNCLIHILDASEVEAHQTQGQALQRRNALAAATKATKTAKAPKTAKTAKAPQTAPQAPADVDPIAEARDAKNAAIIATIPLVDGKNPEAKRQAVRNKLAQLHKAGYRYARLERNKKHQLDGLHIYPGEKGRGRDAAFMGCTTQQAQQYRERADKAREAGKPMPKRPAGVFIWSPVGGGNLYARGIFGPVTEA